MKLLKKKTSLSEIYEGRLILINKPLNWTSFQVVKKVRNVMRRLYNIKKIKIGHAGTLDPLASGLLILATGKATKQIFKFAPTKMLLDIDCSTFKSSSRSCD